MRIIEQLEDTIAGLHREHKAAIDRRDEADALYLKCLIASTVRYKEAWEAKLHVS